MSNDEQTPKDPSEPDGIEKMAALFGITENPDHNRVRAIWAAFKWEVQTQAQDYEAISKLCDKYVAACDKIKNETIRAQVVQQFNYMKARLTEFTVKQEESVCPKCGLNTFICPCPKE